MTEQQQRGLQAIESATAWLELAVRSIPAAIASGSNEVATEEILEAIAMAVARASQVAREARQTQQASNPVPRTNQ